MNGLQPWHWLVLSLGLITLEVFATTEFFIGIAAASFLTAVLTFALPQLGWEWQICLFAVGSVLLTLGYFKFFRNVNQRTDSPLLNDRAAQLVGTRFTLESALNEVGPVMVHGTRWEARCAQALPAGEIVEITGTQGMTLFVQPVAQTRQVAD